MSRHLVALLTMPHLQEATADGGVLGEGGTFAHHSGWGGKLAGATLRIAGLLHAAERPHVDPCARLVSPETLDRAIRIGRYCIPHALAAFGCMGQRSETDQLALRVLRWVREQGLQRFTEADCYRTLRRSFGVVSKVRPVLEELETRGYLRPEPPSVRSGAGRKASPGWEVHPAALSRNPRNPQN